ncbi:glycosyltransferase [Mesorhizobium sp. M2D.F.Ca.ET.185.01.1.1]|uniref:glycosyltransferase n=1 Tax=unclassified Mesorhizobium TaxID=325217 RepID=UPI000FCC7002|nr:MULTISPECIES: glycosyltransferase [unclassified Mesorhizobium]TGP77055.1 glycosyltransferase [bacterium M00.F.Ca.ET.227.01.1.1]TGP84078.1 glycosyltransferase [bacterium M00.F.Ca.ET.221.01.1.1]TGP88571.1 glycosyltransferase [bacterium M00.F.Ca.ET.222.01.1.1]TGU03192.1 glycosyltransferase [bacterium M00.F.Ca.ET.163.01.1.1]TGU30802.1 glycosyltransferase [bacterium M00.F.Ca.ET.156.01.1.1]TGU45058.1 glycosyltransferase [bacterium M00.F.Ca.ET.146.01.1.1]TGV67534.1 glycosyltransferase [Mesorhizo
MRILLSTYGSRGDVEPLAALGAALQAHGVEARVSAPGDDEFAALAARAGVAFAPAFAPVREWAKEMVNRSRSATPEDRARLISGQAAEIAARQYETLSAAAEGCDAVVAFGLFPSCGAARMLAERRGMRYMLGTFCPIWLPSPHNRPHEYPGHPLPSGVTDNRLLWEADIRTKNALFGEAINGHRASLGLPPVQNVRDYVFGDPVLLACDPVLGPWLPSDLIDAVQTGALILPDERPLPDRLSAFLDAGPPPVYVGFGSISVAREAGRAAIEAIRARGLRTVLAQGWAELGLVDDGDDCLEIGEVNQQALFARVGVVIHHGGAGTTVAAARAGAPQVIVPQIGDQPYWAKRAAELGIGAAHDGPVPTAESLSATLDVALAPETRARAAAVAGKIRADGAEVAARLLIELLSQSSR